MPSSTGILRLGMGSRGQLYSLPTPKSWVTEAMGSGTEPL